MASKKIDGLAAGLDDLARTGGSNALKIDVLFGDRPDVLDAIRRARSERKLGYSQIADYLTANGHDLSSKAVKSWLLKQGIR